MGKRAFLVLVIALGLLVFPALSTGEPVKITATLTENHRPVVEAFNKLHKDIQVELLLAKPYSQLDSVLVEYLGGAGSDIQFLEWYEYIDKFIDAGVFTSLAPYIKKDRMESQIRDIPPVVVNRFSRNGELYAIPEYLHMRAVGINRTYREEAGLPVPDNNWNWSDYQTFARKLTKKDANNVVKIYGTTMNPAWPTVQGWLAGTGVLLHKPGDHSVIDLIKPEIVKAFEFMQEIRKEHKPYSSMAEFLNGNKVAMQESMASNYAKNMQTSIYDFDTVEHPIGPGGTRAIVVNDGSFFISNSSKQKEAAWEFLKFFYSREGQLIYIATTGFQPARMSLVMDWKNIVQSKWPKIGDKWFVPFFNAYGYAQVTEYFTNSQVLQQYLNKMCVQIINNGEPVLATLESVVPAANAFIAEGRAAAKK